MAIHFHNDYSAEYASRNFGDDINPFLLRNFFESSIIDSDAICIMGIGTILNDRNIEMMEHYDQKIIFSSGAGYGDTTKRFDDSWDIACVRGPLTAQRLGLPTESGICDGAILLANIYDPKPIEERDGTTVFVPHVNSGWAAGVGLREICDEFGLIYLSPEAPFEDFIHTIRNASLVVAEAMHGAILADTMRTPWIPVRYAFHHEFKWKDWFQSIELPYQSAEIKPQFWNAPRNKAVALIKYLFLKLKQNAAKNSVGEILLHGEPLLSRNDINQSRRASLLKKVAEINEKYG